MRPLACSPEVGGRPEWGVPHGRGGWAANHHVITPENRTPSALPWLDATVVHKLVSPRRQPAQFAESLLLIESGGGGRSRLDAQDEHFLYCLSGEIETAVSGTSVLLRTGGFAYLAPGAEVTLANRSHQPVQLLWVTRRYLSSPGVSVPESLSCDRGDVPEVAFTPGIERRVLSGNADPRHDFSMILMRFEPGARLGMIEIHDEEHGLWMTAGSGVYQLGEREYRVCRGDFIYMAPYCPQTFVADNEGAEYLLYKDAFRGPLDP